MRKMRTIAEQKTTFEILDENKIPDLIHDGEQRTTAMGFYVSRQIVSIDFKHWGMGLRAEDFYIQDAWNPSEETPQMRGALDFYKLKMVAC
jgi:hypothetical protein